MRFGSAPRRPGSKGRRPERPVTPFTRSRAAVSRHDPLLYKERNRVERFFGKLKQFRRVATRYDKLLANFMGFVTLAAIAILLR
jgi:putative transposase